VTPASRVRPPAYAKALMTKRKAGLSPSNSLCIALNWRAGKGLFVWRVVAPPGIPANGLDWAVAAGLDCLLLGEDQKRMDDVARELLRLPLHRLVGVSDHITVYWPAAE
jgi:hypothetical protein